MAYIYKITNDINGKVYIGKTAQSVHKRFTQHCSDRMKRNMEKRPLYDAMNKYGVEHFSVETIEECNISDASDREKYWINYYNSYHNGHNATTGGDGKSWCDYNAVFNLYKQGLSFREIAKCLGYDSSSCRNIVKSMGVSQDEITDRSKQWFVNPIVQYDLNSGEILNIYKSSREAARSIGKKRCTGISNALIRGTGKAYGYGWKRISIDEYVS